MPEWVVVAVALLGAGGISGIVSAVLNARALATQAQAAEKQAAVTAKRQDLEDACRALDALNTAFEAQKSEIQDLREQVREIPVLRKGLAEWERKYADLLHQHDQLRNEYEELCREFEAFKASVAKRAARTKPQAAASETN